METTHRCSICHESFPVREPTPPPPFPFCSDRCRLIDLGRWLDGEYRVEGDPALPDEPLPDDPA